MAKAFTGIFTREAGWFRVFGWGLAYHDHHFLRPLFSERNGLGPKRLKLGKWCFWVLRRKEN